MNQGLLEFDIRLLILRYGRRRVLDALARLGDQTPEELDQQLRTLEKSGDRRRQTNRPKPSALDLAASESRDRPDIAEPLRALAVSFQNRAFLPQLRDVQRFLDRAGSSHGKLTSRAAAAPVLIRMLAKLTRTDLLTLTETRSSGESDYSLLARAIMGTAAAKPRDPTGLSEPGGKPPKG